MGKGVGQLVMDGWTNLLTGMGILNRDKTRSTKYEYVRKMSQIELTNLFRGDGLAKRVINLVVREMIRKGFKIIGDTDGIVKKEYKRLNGDKYVAESERWARLYGGSLMVLWIDDGVEDMEEPLKEDNIKKIEMIKVFQRFRVDKTSDVERDPESDHFLEPNTYTITPISGASFRVHWTRVIEFDGMVIPDEYRARNAGWGDSVYESIFEWLRRLGSVYSGVENIVDDFVTGWLKINNLQDMIATGKEDLIKTRLQLLDMSKNIINTKLLDDNEEYTKVSSSVAGLPDLVDRFWDGLSSVTGIPVTLLRGTSPKGLQATGAADIRFFYDNIGSEQIERLYPQQRRLLTLIQKQQDSETKGKEIENWDIEYLPLWEQTEKEAAETRKSQAETDKMYIESGVLEADEVAISRFGGDEYSTDTHIDVESREKDEGEE